MLSFKAGDLIHSANGKRSVQVQSANPMGWDEYKMAMNQGTVTYLEYEVHNKTLSKQGQKTCSQMQFLQLLIYGKHAN